MINFVTVIFVTRFLSPAQVGSYAVALAIITTVDVCRELNVTAYGVRSNVLDLSLCRSIFGISLASTFAITIFMITVVYFSHGNNEFSLLRSMLFIMVPSYLLAPLTVPSLTHFRRNLRFKELMALKIGGPAGRSVLTITLLLSGVGPLALAAGYSASKLLEAVIVLVIPTPFRFVRPSLSGWKGILSFSFLSTAAQLVGTIGASLAEILSGRFLGMAAAGYYNRGTTLPGLCRTGVESAVIPVAFSAFSAERRRAGGDVNRSYLAGLTILTVVAWPAFAVLGILAAPLTNLLFGVHWIPSANVTQILCIGASIYIVGAMAPSFLTSLDEVGTLLQRESVIQLPRLVLILLASRISIEAVAWAVVTSYVISLCIDQTALSKVAGIKLIDTWLSVRKSLIVLLLVIVTAVPISFISAGFTPLAQVLLVSLPCICVWLLSLPIINHPMIHEINLLVKGLSYRIFVKKYHD